MAIKQSTGAQISVEVKANIAEFQEKMNTLQRRMGDANREFRNWKTSIENTGTVTEKYTGKIEHLSKQIEIQKQRVAETTKEIQELTDMKSDSIDDEEAWTDLMRDANNELLDQQNQLQKLENQLYKTNKRLMEYQINNDSFYGKLSKGGEKLNKFGKEIDSIANKMLKASTMVGGIGVAGYKAYLDYEDALAGVDKTTEFTQQGLTDFGNKMREVAKNDIPIAVEELLALAEAGGQFGVAEEYLQGYAETMAKLNTATNLQGQGGAEKLAQFVAVMGISQAEFENIGSAIVELGNNLATSEASIIEMAQRLAGAGKVIGLTEADILGLSGALSSMGIEAQAGGTAFTKIFIDMEQSVADGGERLEDFAKVAGMTADEFEKLYKSNPAEAIADFIAGIGKSNEQGESAIKILDDLEIKEVRLRDVLLRTSGAHGILSDAIKMSNDAYKENIALDEEAQKRYQTQKSQLQLVKNRIKDNLIDIGEKMLPLIDNVLQKVNELATRFSDLSDEQLERYIELARNFIKLSLAMKALGMATKYGGQFLKFIGDLGKTALLNSQTDRLNQLFKLDPSNIIETTEATKGLTSAVRASKGTFTGFGAILGSINPLILAMGTGVVAVGAGYSLYKKYVDAGKNSSIMLEGSIHGLNKAFFEMQGGLVVTQEELENMGLAEEGITETSKEFQEALHNSQKRITEFNRELRQSSLDGVWTEEETNNLIGRMSETLERVKDVFEGDENEIYQAMKKTFSIDGSLSGNDEEYLSQFSNQAYLDKVKEYEEELSGIYDKIEENNGKITKAQEERIKAINVELEALELQQQAQNERELALAKARVLNKGVSANLEKAGEYLTERKQLAEDEIEEIRTNSDLTIATLEEVAENQTGAEKQATLNKIKQAEKNRDRRIKNIRENYQAEIDALIEGNKNLEDNLNPFTGEQYTKQEQKSKELLDVYREHYQELNSISETGMYSIKNTTTGEFENMLVVVDDVTGEIVSVYNTETYEMINLSDEQIGKLDELKKTYNDLGWAVDETSRGLVSIVKGTTERTVENLEKLGFNVDKTTGKVTYMDEVITDTNGNPIKIKDNTDITNENIRILTRAIKGIPKRKFVSVEVDGYETARLRNISRRYGIGSVATRTKVGVAKFATGLYSVPYDEYPAILHKGERVLTKTEAQLYNQQEKNTDALLSERLDEFLNMSKENSIVNNRSSNSNITVNVQMYNTIDSDYGSQRAVRKLREELNNVEYNINRRRGGAY